MVSDQMDMLPQEEAEPESDIEAGHEARRKIALIEEIAANGEAILTLIDGSVVEVHGDDTHFYPNRGVFFTEAETDAGEEAESWYFAEDIISVQRH